MNDYYICVRRFVASDPELPDSLYILFNFFRIKDEIFILIQSGIRCLHTYKLGHMFIVFI